MIEQRINSAETFCCPVPLVCPHCRKALEQTGDRFHCAACARTFPFENGFPDLVVGDRFDDPTDEDCMCYEENSNRDLTDNYWIPLFKKFWPKAGAKLLSIGCGTGLEVERLQQAGFVAVGIDNGNRAQVWPRRACKDSLILANGMRLPFSDASFDGVFCGCVFPHVGVIGDSNKVDPRYLEHRQALASEMARVLKPGGSVIVASPNRLFPFDIFHGRRPGSYKPRPNWPGNPFLLSASDYIRLFSHAGCRRPEPQPVENYWGFIRSKKSLKGILLGAPVRFIFWLVSRGPMAFLRSSPITPWIVVKMEKGATP